MTIVPQCYNKRYEAFQEIFNQLDLVQQHDEAANAEDEPPDTGEDFGTQLMCKFWNILKTNPRADLEQAVKERIPLCIPQDDTPCCECTGSSPPTNDSRLDLHQMVKDLCNETQCIMREQQVQLRVDTQTCCKEGTKGGKVAGTGGMKGVGKYGGAGGSKGGKDGGAGGLKTGKAIEDRGSKGGKGGGKGGKGGGSKGTKGGKGNEDTGCISTCPSMPKRKVPLSEALNDIKKAQTHDTKCAWKLNDLMQTEQRLSKHIKMLEQRELEGIAQLQKADCMWVCMEETYCTKLKQSLERQAELLNEEKEIERSLDKWRRRDREVSALVEDLKTAAEKTKEQAEVKRCEVKCSLLENQGIRSRVTGMRDEMDSLKLEAENRKQASEYTRISIKEEIAEFEKLIREERVRRHEKEEAGKQALKEARDNLTTANRVLLQQELEYEDHKAEEQQINTEIDLLNETMDHCQDRCMAKLHLFNDDIANVDKQIKEFDLKCIRCSVCLSTSDVRKLCTDCPRCVRERQCLYEDKTHCSEDVKENCCCHILKSKFIENILENMYNILEADVKKKGGDLAENVVECLKRSRNGKLDLKTREKVHEYVKKTIEKNLDLSVVGGAVKTRCEMDPEMSKELQLCLKEIKVAPLPKPPKKPDPVKASCKRWGGDKPCNCPRGPNACDCVKRAAAKAGSPEACQPESAPSPSKPDTVTCGMPPPELCTCVTTGAAQLCKQATSTTTGAKTDTEIGTSNPDLCLCKAKMNYVPCKSSEARDRLISEVAGDYRENTEPGMVGDLSPAKVIVPEHEICLDMPPISSAQPAITIPQGKVTPNLSARTSIQATTKSPQHISSAEHNRESSSQAAASPQTSLLSEILSKISRSLQSILLGNQSESTNADLKSKPQPTSSAKRSSEQLNRKPSILSGSLPLKSREPSKSVLKTSRENSPEKPAIKLSRELSPDLARPRLVTIVPETETAGHKSSYLSNQGSISSVYSRGKGTSSMRNSCCCIKGDDLNIKQSLDTKGSVKFECTEVHNKSTQERSTASVGTCAKICAKAKSQAAQVVEEKAVDPNIGNLRTGKRNPDDSMLCNNKSCTGPCNKRKNKNNGKNTKVYDVIASPLGRFADTVHLPLSSMNIPCNCKNKSFSKKFVEACKKSGQKRTNRDNPIFIAQTKIKRSTFKRKNASRHSYGHSSFAAETSLLFDTVEEKTQVREYNRHDSPGCGTDTVNNAVREWAVASFNELERMRLISAKHSNMEQQLPTFLRDQRMSRNLPAKK